MQARNAAQRDTQRDILWSLSGAAFHPPALLPSTFDEDILLLSSETSSSKHSTVACCVQPAKLPDPEGEAVDAARRICALPSTRPRWTRAVFYIRLESRIISLHKTIASQSPPVGSPCRSLLIPSFRRVRCVRASCPIQQSHSPSFNANSFPNPHILSRVLHALRRVLRGWATWLYAAGVPGAWGGGASSAPSASSASSASRPSRRKQRCSLSHLKSPVVEQRAMPSSMCSLVRCKQLSQPNLRLSTALVGGTSATGEGLARSYSPG